MVKVDVGATSLSVKTFAGTGPRILVVHGIGSIRHDCLGEMFLASRMLDPLTHLMTGADRATETLI